MPIVKLASTKNSAALALCGGSTVAMKLASTKNSVATELHSSDSGRVTILAGQDYVGALTLTSTGPPIPAISIPAIVSWLWDAVSTVTNVTVNVSSLTSSACQVWLRFTETGTGKTFTMKDTAGDATTPHSITSVLAVSFAARTYNQVEYKLIQGGVEIVAFTVWTGASLTTPTVGGDPAEGGGPGPE